MDQGSGHLTRANAALPPLPADLEYCVVGRAGAPLGRRGRWLAFGALAGASLAVATGFAMAGAWPVVPYSVLEIGLVGCAFACMERRAGDWERLTVAGDRVVVEREAGGRRERAEFNRYWLRVEVEAAGFGRPRQVTLREGRAAWVFGNALPVAQRLAVARELRRMTGVH